MRARFLVLLLATACGDDDQASAPPAQEPPTRELPAPDLRILAITDLKGYLEPCGCTSHPLGGIDRMAARVKALSEQAPSILVASGDLFFGNEGHGGPESSVQDSWRAQTLVGILNDVGLAAATVGELDLAHGVGALGKLDDEADFPLLAVQRSTEGVDAGPETKLPTFESHLVREVGGKSVAFVGVSDFEAEGVSGGSVVEGAQETIAGLPPSVDMVVAMVRGDRRLARQIAQIPRVGFVLQSGLDREEAIAPQQSGQAWLVHGGRQGQGLLVLDLYLREGEGLFNLSEWNLDAEREQLDSEIAELEASLERWEEEGQPESAITRQQGRLQRMRRDRAALRPAPMPESGSAFRARWVALDDDAGSDAQIRRRLERFDRRINDHNQEAFANRAPPPAREGAARYVGSAACQSCHEAAYSWWQGHKHGRAYQTLVDRNKQFHLDCVGCHVTGYELPGGSTVTQNLDGALVNVGCEVCHGPGSQHLSAPSEQGMERDPEERLCVGCHNEEHSDLFNFAAYRATLLVPGHGRPAQ